MARFASPAERVLARIELHGGEADGCWLFTGNVDKNGYGCITCRVRPRPANPTRVRCHKVVWEWANGRKVRRGFSLDHRPTCPKNCCNPEHVTECLLRTNTARANYWRARAWADLGLSYRPNRKMPEPMAA